VPFNVTAKNAALTAQSALITFIGAHTLVDPTLTTTAAAGEASGGSYARQGVTWATAGSSLQANSGALTIPVPAGTFGFLTFFNHVTSNGGTNYFGYAPMGGASAIKGFAVVDPTIGNSTYYATAHGLSNTDRVMVYAEFGGTLPTGLTAGTIYFVVGSATNTFQLSATSGGAAVTLSALGSGLLYWQRVVPEVFNAPGNITVAIGALVLDATAA
jgi:hypothetical protein